MVVAEMRFPKLLGMLLFGAVAVWMLSHFLSVRREPLYQGKRVSYWIAELRANQGHRIVPAQRALEEMGEEVMPYIVKVLQRRSKLDLLYRRLWDSQLVRRAFAVTSGRSGEEKR